MIRGFLYVRMPGIQTCRRFPLRDFKIIRLIRTQKRDGRVIFDLKGTQTFRHNSLLTFPSIHILESLTLVKIILNCSQPLNRLSSLPVKK